MDLLGLFVLQKTGIVLSDKNVQELEEKYVILKDLDRHVVLNKIREIVMKNDKSIVGFSGLSYVLEPHDSGQAEFVPLLKQLCLRKRERVTCSFGDDARCARRVSILTAILSIVQEALISNISVSSRSIFYRDPNLFENVEVSDATILDLCCMLGCSRSHLNIHTSSRGLFAGCVRLKMGENEEIFGRPSSKESVRIPNCMGKITKIVGNVDYVLVVEKQSVFDHLLEQDFHDKFNCVLITGCGQPDVNTRIFVCMLYKNLDKPVYGLVDPDPHGLLIFLTYKYGSASMSFDNLGLATPAMYWIGVRIEDLIDSTPSLLKSLQKNDESILKNLLSKSHIIKNEGELRVNIKAMCSHRKKGEIECLYSKGVNALADYILDEIENAKKTYEQSDEE